MEILSSFGPHLTIDASIINSNILSNLEIHKKFLKEIPSLIGMTPIIDPIVMYYDGGEFPEDSGPTGFVVIATSHISIHSFEKKGYCFIDIFSCKIFDTDKATQYIKNLFKPEKLTINIYERGLDFPR